MIKEKIKIALIIIIFLILICIMSNNAKEILKKRKYHNTIKIEKDTYSFRDLNKVIKNEEVKSIFIKKNKKKL